MTGDDDELIERLRRTLFAEADAITPRHEPLRRADVVHPAPVHGRRHRTGRLPWVMLATTAVAAAIVATIAVIEGTGSPPTVKIGTADTGKSSTTTTAAPATTVPSSATTTATTNPVAVSPVQPVLGPVAAGFQPTSVTFISAHEGWAAGTAPCGPRYCVTIARTFDGGHSWYAGVAPAATPFGSKVIAWMPQAASLRFADPGDGWLVTSNGQTQQLWSTHDGGSTWGTVTLPVPGTITSLEAAGGAAGSVYAAVLDSSDGTVHIEASPTTSDSWTDTPTGVPIGGGPIPDAQLVLYGSSGWMIENDRTVVGGARLAGGHWVKWTPPCSGANGPGSLAAANATSLFAVCDVGVEGPPSSPPPGAAMPSDWGYSSSDGGSSFTVATQLPVEGPVLVSGATPRTLTASGTLGYNGYSSSMPAGLVTSTDGGRSWRTVDQLTARQSVVYLGFTTAEQGVAITSGSGGSNQLLMTHDAGVTWAPVNF